jgi:hypothetical protein
VRQHRSGGRGREYEAEYARNGRELEWLHEILGTLSQGSDRARGVERCMMCKRLRSRGARKHTMSRDVLASCQGG